MSSSKNSSNRDWPQLAVVVVLSATHDSDMLLLLPCIACWHLLLLDHKPIAVLFVVVCHDTSWSSVQTKSTQWSSRQYHYLMTLIRNLITMSCGLVNGTAGTSQSSAKSSQIIWHLSRLSSWWVVNIISFLSCDSQHICTVIVDVIFIRIRKCVIPQHSWGSAVSNWANWMTGWVIT